MALTPAASRKGRPPVVRVAVALSPHVFERVEAAARRAGVTAPAWAAEALEIAVFQCEHITEPPDHPEERSPTWPST